MLTGRKEIIAKMFKNMPEFINKVAPSVFFVSHLDYFKFKKYCEPLNRDITNSELDFLSNVRGGETKNQNFGIYNGNVVCVDFS